MGTLKIAKNNGHIFVTYYQRGKPAFELTTDATITLEELFTLDEDDEKLEFCEIEGKMYATIDEQILGEVKWNDFSKAQQRP